MKSVVCSPGRQTWVKPNADFMLFWTAEKLDSVLLISTLPKFCHNFGAHNCKFVTAYIRSPVRQMSCFINQCLHHGLRWWQNLALKQIKLKSCVTVTDIWHNVSELGCFSTWPVFKKCAYWVLWCCNELDFIPIFPLNCEQEAINQNWDPVSK